MIGVGRGAIPATVALLAATVIVRSSAREPGVYHPDPQHLWNRLHDALFVRVGTDGVEYGRDRIEPLLWRRSTHLLAGVFLFNTLVQNFPPDHADSPPRPTAMPVEDVLAAAVAWKRRQEDWLLLKRLMARRDRPRRVRLSDRGTWSGR
jgi:hypothetical protein